MASSATPSEATDGPVLSLVNKRLRALRKKLNRIVQMEEAIAQGKPIKKEQEDVLRSKPSVLGAIDELEKLRPQLFSSLQEELSLAAQRLPRDDDAPAASSEKQQQEPKDAGDDAVVKDVLNLLYFGSMFTVSSQSDYTSTMLTRTHERGCCLTYDYVTDEVTDLLKERDLDLIATLSGLLISRPADSSLSHKNALQKCVHHAKQWITNSEEPIEPDSSVTYALLRERLNKIIESDYFTTTPEMKAPVDMAAAAASGNYAPFQVPVSVPVQVESQEPQYEQKEEAGTEFQGHEVNESDPIDDGHEDEVAADNPSEFASAQEENINPQVEELNQGEREQKDHQYNPRRNYNNQRGGRGGGNGVRRGYPNGRGGRSGGRGGGPYQNGRGHYYEQQPNYYPRNYYNNRGRGGRGGVHPFNNHGPADHGGHAPADVGVAS